jgi:serine/threonine protein kinase
MTPERWQQINELYHNALELDASGQATFLNQACAADAELRDEVESLIASHDQAGSFISEPALKVAAKGLAEDQATSLVGRSFSHYRIESILGVGGMGEVYLAEDNSLDRKVALKLLPAQFTNDAERLRRFEREARAASALNHPNILTIYEIGQADGHHYTVTEFIDGETLREHMAGTHMKLDESLDIATQVASALAAAHEAGIVHRDIKPENVMLRSDGFVKVLDFGLAKLLPRHASAAEPEALKKAIVKTNPGMVMGTIQYMSPEQARGQDVDARTDIWSLGVVLYEMVTGRAPFAGETPSHAVVSILETQPLPLTQENEMPRGLERIVDKALRKTEERYQTVTDLLLDLKSLKQELEVGLT